MPGIKFNHANKSNLWTQMQPRVVTKLSTNRHLVAMDIMAWGRRLYKVDRAQFKLIALLLSPDETSFESIEYIANPITYSENLILCFCEPVAVDSL